MFEDESPTPLSILEGLLAGDDDAWNRFVSIASPVVYARCRKEGLSDADAGDVTQDAFLRVHKSMHTFRRNGENLRFRFWFNTVMKSAIIDFRRKDAKNPNGTGDSAVQGMLNNVADTIDPETTFSSSDPDKVLLLRNALDNIKQDFEESTWQAFLLIHIEKVPGPEVAERLGKTSGAVRASAHRVKKRLEEELDGLFD